MDILDAHSIMRGRKIIVLHSYYLGTLVGTARKYDEEVGMHGMDFRLDIYGKPRLSAEHPNSDAS